MEKRYELHENENGELTLELIQEKTGKPITYADVLSAFRREYPCISVEDYRPADYFPFSIIVWTQGRKLLVSYQPSYDSVFILGNEPA